MIKQFKNNFGVTGPKNLLQAFAKDCEEIGWKQDKAAGNRHLYFAGNNETFFKKNHYWFCDNATGGKLEFNLPQDYNTALEAAKETIEEELKPGDWVKVLDTKNVREYNKRAVGYIFQVKEEDYKNWMKEKSSPTIENIYHVNYLLSDLQIISKEEAEEHILKQAIEESGLKVGDTVNRNILNKWTSIKGNAHYKNSGDWKYTYSTWSKNKIIEGFKLIDNIPVIIFSNTDSDFTVKLEGLSKFVKEYQEQSITIGEYKTEVVNGKLKWGCQNFELKELQVVKKLLNSEISADITIHGTKIDKTLIEKLEKLLQNE